MISPHPNLIRRARHKAGLTQKQAAAMVGVTTRAWQYYEAGQKPIAPERWELFKFKTKKG